MDKLEKSWCVSEKRSYRSLIVAHNGENMRSSSSQSVAGALSQSLSTMKFLKFFSFLFRGSNCMESNQYNFVSHHICFPVPFHWSLSVIHGCHDQRHYDPCLRRWWILWRDNASREPSGNGRCLCPAFRITANQAKKRSHINLILLRDIKLDFSLLYFFD